MRRGGNAAALFVSEAENALGVAVKDFLHHLVGIAELAPFLEKTRMRNARIIAAEHDLVLQPRANIGLERSGEIFWRPARQLPEDVALVQRHRRHLVDPGPVSYTHLTLPTIYSV